MLYKWTSYLNASLAHSYVVVGSRLKEAGSICIVQGGGGSNARLEG